MTTATYDPTQDALDAAMTPSEDSGVTGPRTYFGEVMHIEGVYITYDEQVGKYVTFDPAIHTGQRRVETSIRIAPLRDGFQPVERQMRDNSAAWKKVFLPSLIALNITARQLAGKYVQYQMVPSGEIYIKRENEATDRDASKEAQRLWNAAGGDEAKYNGALLNAGHGDWISATKVKSAPRIIAVYGSRDECQAAADTFFTSRRDRESTPAPTPAPAAPTAAPKANAADAAKNKAFALRSVALKWEVLGGELGKWDTNIFAQFEKKFNEDPSVNQWVKLTDDEVIAITGQPF